MSTTAAVKLLSVKEVADIFGVSKQWVLEHSNGKRNPRIECVKLGKCVRFRPESVERFIEICSSAAAAASGRSR